MNEPLCATTVPYYAAESLDDDAFTHIRRSMMLNHFKWDSQVGDVTTLAPFPIVLHAAAWRQLAGWAEALSAEVALAERFFLNAPAWLERLGIPAGLRSIFSALDDVPTPSAARVIRYDFHWTRTGWAISEINSDVPGGYCEASSFTPLLARHFPGMLPAGDPAARWTDALIAAAACDGSAERGSALVFLSAPGFMEDQQITAYLADRARRQGCCACLAAPEQLVWTDGRAALNVGNEIHGVGAIVRFYQAEWLPRLPRCTGWRHFFSGGRTPVSNSGSAVILESKRFPLLLDELPLPLPACRQLFPRSFDPRAVNWKADENLIVKSALSNNADAVGNAALLPRQHWENLSRALAANPGDWVVQQRFDPMALSTPLGPVFPCIGVYTVDGRAAGIYGRVSRKQIVDYEAIDCAVLIESGERE